MGDRELRHPLATPVRGSAEPGLSPPPSYRIGEFKSLLVPSLSGGATQRWIHGIRAKEMLCLGCGGQHLDIASLGAKPLLLRH